MNSSSLVDKSIDELVYQSVFGSDDEKAEARFAIWQLGKQKGVFFASINDLYMARGAGKIAQKFTVPAMNLRGMTYDVARAIFSVAVANNVGVLIFEIARSEMGYTDQNPLEYSTVVMAAALKEGFSGPLFIQGDHFQAKAEKMGVPKAGEIEAIEKLIDEAVNAGFYNIDIDMSTLVDLDKPTVTEQQAPNIKYSLRLAEKVRSVEPEGVTISLGGEIGHIGGKNSTVEDFVVFVSGFNDGFNTQSLSSQKIGMSKVSVATGTSHGGVVLADGKLADVAVDFNVLSDISRVAQTEYKMGGAVQHGASTLPDHMFDEFPKHNTLEIHLATGFQNIQMNSSAFPKELLAEMYAYVDAKKSDERKSGQTDEQFHYELRKKTWGPFKKQSWDIAEDKKAQIRAEIATKVHFWFDKLNVFNTKEVVAHFIKPVIVEKTLADFGKKTEKIVDVKGLSD